MLAFGIIDIEPAIATMKKTVLLSAFLTLFLGLAFDARPAISIEKLQVNAAQLASEAVAPARKGQAKQKGIRKHFKEKFRAIVENAPTNSNGSIALVLVLSSILVFFVMPGVVISSVAFYVTGLFFAVVGIGKDKNKAAAIAALSLAILPVSVLFATLIEFIIKGFFD